MLIYLNNLVSAMANKTRNFYHIVMRMLVISFLLNFIWESIHAVLLYEGHNIPAYDYFMMMSYVSVIDALLILVIYLIVSGILKDLFWMKKLNPPVIGIFVFIGIIIAATIEYDAIYLRHKWSYSALMPTVFGLGISPLVQLSITGLLSIIITKELMKI